MTHTLLHSLLRMLCVETPVSRVDIQHSMVKTIFMVVESLERVPLPCRVIRMMTMFSSMKNIMALAK